MAERDERLIDRDPKEDEENQTPVNVPFYKNPTFKAVLKISLSLGIITTLITGLLITNSRLSGLETIFKDTLTQVAQVSEQQKILIENLKTLTSEHKRLVSKVATLDLESAQGELTQALTILDTQSKAIDKQLAVTRNGLISLSRMIKGSRVWQEDYSGQYKLLFDQNKAIKEMINDLRGVKAEKREEPQYIEMDF